VIVNATLNGSLWPGSVNYTLFGGGVESFLTSVPTTLNSAVGTYSIGYASGGPTGAPPLSITPFATQTLNANGTIAFTMNFSGGTGRASLQIAFSNLQSASTPCANVLPAWVYTSTLTETGGVGMTVTKFTFDFYDKRGNHLNTQTNTGSDFVNLFASCSSGSVHIPASGRVCASLCTQLDGRGSGSVIMTFYGTDDNGNQVSFTSSRLVLPNF
jgi:hypothetical protein